MLFGAATARCYLGHFFMKRASDACLGPFSLHARTKGEWGRSAVSRFTGTTQNTGTITKHRKDHRNMKKKIPSGSGDGGRRNIKVFERIYPLFL